MKNSLNTFSPFEGGIAVFALAVLLYLPLSQMDISMLDEGALLYVAERLTKGDVLYRDLVTGIMPGVYYLQALFFSIFGFSVLTGRILACLTIAASTFLIYSISRFFIQKKTSFLISILFISMALPAYRWPGYSQLSITFVLLSLLFFLHYLNSSSLSTILFSGAAAALAVFFKQNYGVFITAGTGCILFARLLGKKELKPLIVFSISFSVPVVLTVLYFYSAGAWHQMVQYTFISLFQKAAGVYYKAYPLLSRENPYFFQSEFLNYIPFRDLSIWALKEGHVSEQWIKNVAAVIFILPPLVIAAGFIHTAQSVIRRKTVPWKEATLVLTSFLIFLGVFPRSDISHLTFILPPVIILAALLAEALPRLRLFTFLKVTAYTLTALFSILNLASSYMPLFHPAPGEVKEVMHLERAYGIKTNHNKAAVIRATTKHINNYTTPDEPILVVPTGAMYYFLSARKSIVPYPLIMPGAMDEATVIKALEKSRLRYIIYSDMSFDEKRLSKHMPLIHKYITENYHIDSSYPITEVGGATYVLKRGPAAEEIIPVNAEAEEALENKKGYGKLEYDFTDRLSEAGSGVILGSGRRVELFRANQVTESAWLLRDVIWQEPGKGLSKVYTAFPLHVPGDSALRFSISQSPMVWHPNDGDGVLFEVYLYDAAAKRGEKLFSRYIDAKNNVAERRWFNYMAGLKKYRGRDLIIYFVTSGGPRLNLTMGKKNRWRHVDKAGWGSTGLVSLSSVPLISPGKDTISEAAGTGAIMAEIARFDDISLFEDEAKKYPQDYDVRMALGLVLNQKTDKKRAAEQFRIALRIYPGGTEARSRLSKYYIDTGEFKRAEDLLTKGLRLTPDNIGFNLSLAKLYRRHKEYEKAITSYTQVLRLEPENAAARLGLSRNYLLAGKSAKARAELEKVLSAHPQSGPALIMLGDYYRFKKDLQNAEESYRKALDKAPHNGIAALKLGRILKAGGRTDEALEFFKAVTASAEGSAAIKKLAQKEIAYIKANGIKE